MSEEVAEEWRPVLEGRYEASSLGRIRRAIPYGKRPCGIMKVKQWGDYLGIKLSLGHKNRRYFSVHTLVALAFHGPPPQPGMEVNHIDANKLNNAASNLEWVTKAEQQAHASRLGLYPYGPANSQAKLSTEAVIEIRRRWKTGRYWGLIRELAKEYGVSATAISKVIRGENHRRTGVST